MNTPAMIHPPIADIGRRPHQLLEVTEWRVVNGEAVIVGVWATNNGVTVAEVRAAVVSIPEAVTA